MIDAHPFYLFLRISYNQLLRYLAFDEITSLNFIDLVTRSSTTASKGSLKGRLGGTVFTFGRSVFPGLPPTQVSFSGISPRTPSTPVISFTGSAAVRAQQSSPTPYMAQAEIGEGDTSETVTQSRIASYFPPAANQKAPISQGPKNPQPKSFQQMLHSEHCMGCKVG